MDQGSKNHSRQIAVWERQYHEADRENNKEIMFYGDALFHERHHRYRFDKEEDAEERKREESNPVIGGCAEKESKDEIK